MARKALNRRLRLLAISTLLAVDGLLLVVFVFRGEAPPRASVEIEPTDPRVAPVFTALEVGGLSAAIDMLEQRASSDSLVLRAGHQLAHALGRRALLRSGGDATILRSCRPAFASGCYHGVVEALLTLRGRIDMRELQDMCAAAGGDDAPGPIYECVHGLGHGLLGALARDVDTALRHCDALDGASFNTSCHEGVFMEAIASTFRRAGGDAELEHDTAEHSHVGTITLEPADPYSPCDRYSDPYAQSCWLFQGFVILRRVNFDPGLALRLCDNASDRRVARCYESVGHQVAGLFQRGDDWIIEQCRKGTAALASRCASGAALALASLDWSGWRVVEFCSAVPGAWRSACRRAAAGTLAQVASPAHQAALCGSSRPEHAEVCRELKGPRGET